MPVIGIDCRFASSASGLGTYTRELTKALLTRGGNWNYLLFTNDDLSWLPNELMAKAATLDAPYRHYSLAEQMRFPAVIGGSGIDLLFSPHFNVPLRCPVPFVCTIHDLILRKFPNDAPFLRRLAYRFLSWQTVRRARAIVTISEATKADILDVYGSTCADKTQVIRPGLSPLFFPGTRSEQDACRQKYHLTRDFLLYVGNAKQHKNVQMLINAFSSVSPSGVDLVLVMSGKEVSTLKLVEGVKLVPAVAGEDLPALYSAAKGFVTATLAEGFGLPIAEAMACGCPVAATNRTGIPEVAGDAAILVEPSVAALASAMRRLLVEDNHARIQAGIERVKRFRWDTAAERLSAIFATLLAHG